MSAHSDFYALCGEVPDCDIGELLRKTLQEFDEFELRMVGIDFGFYRAPKIDDLKLKEIEMEIVEQIRRRMNRRRMNNG